MIISFADIELNPDKEEILKAGRPVHVEKRVFSLLALLVANHDRLVSKDEIIETVWDGRVVSDSAVSTAVKDARKAVGDDGNRQKIIKTLHGRGFRCVAEVHYHVEDQSETLPASPAQKAEQNPTSELMPIADKPSVAVLPFIFYNLQEDSDPLADALPAEVISALSRLRWLSVTARGSSFRFRNRSPDPAAIRKVLKVGYFLTGSIEQTGSKLTISAELAETAEGRVIWSENFSLPRADVQALRPEIVASVVAALEIYVPMNEANTALSLDQANLDAWSQYHIGLQHLYRFNKRDNLVAKSRFEKAIQLDPRFARAHAGLSFSFFQDVFMHYGESRDAQVFNAQSSAERGLEIDYLDPFANYCMGRVCWLTGDLEGATGWLSRAVELSPSFAQGHYVGALIGTMSGRSDDVREGTKTAMSLSPLDPLGYAMRATHGMSYINEARFEDAAHWTEQAARAPGAHHILTMTTAAAHQLNGDQAKAEFWAGNVRKRRPDISADDFFSSFPYSDNPGRAFLEKAFKKLRF